MHRAPSLQTATPSPPPTPTPPPPPAYPWHTAVRLAPDDPLFYQTLLDALQRTDFPAHECVGFCTGRCAQPPDASDPLRLNDVRVVGPVCASRAHRHWILCGTLPFYVLPAAIATAQPTTPDTLGDRFGTFRGLTVHWVPVDRKTWYLQGVPGQYKWTSTNKSGAHLAKKHIHVWRFGSVHRGDHQHPLHCLCTQWTSCTFARTAHNFWTISYGASQSAINVDQCCQQLQHLLSTAFGTRCTPALQTLIRKQVEWVYQAYAQTSVSNRVRHVWATLQWPIGVLVQTLQHRLRTFDPSGKGTIPRTQQHEFARLFDLTSDQARTVFDTPSWSSPSGVKVSLLCIHCECVLGATASGGTRLPLKRTTVTTDHSAVVYYELQHDWDTGDAALDQHLWESLLYESATPADGVVSPTSDDTGDTRVSPPVVRVAPRYRGASTVMEPTADGKRRLRYRGGGGRPTHTEAPLEGAGKGEPAPLEPPPPADAAVDSPPLRRPSSGGWLEALVGLWRSGCGPWGSHGDLT